MSGMNELLSADVFVQDIFSFKIQHAYLKRFIWNGCLLTIVLYTLYFFFSSNLCSSMWLLWSTWVIHYPHVIFKLTRHQLTVCLHCPAQDLGLVTHIMWHQCRSRQCDYSSVHTDHMVLSTDHRKARWCWHVETLEFFTHKNTEEATDCLTRKDLSNKYFSEPLSFGPHHPTR